VLLDLGCGAADITLRFARRFPQTAIVGLDAGSNMLARARLEVAAAGLENQISLLQAYLPDHGLLPKRFDAIVCNSLLHHLSDPGALWASIKTSGRPGAAVAVMDLLRPETETRLAELVEMYAGLAPPLLKQDFAHSLAAAYEINEIEAQLDTAGLNLSVDAISDRHVLVWGYL
jgi:ubiquinone/menaquinone biosynthesis C-methylase UbiE